MYGVNKKVLQQISYGPGMATALSSPHCPIFTVCHQRGAHVIQAASQGPLVLIHSDDTDMDS